MPASLVDLLEPLLQCTLDVQHRLSQTRGLTADLKLFTAQFVAKLDKSRDLIKSASKSLNFSASTSSGMNNSAVQSPFDLGVLVLQNCVDMVQRAIQQSSAHTLPSTASKQSSSSSKSGGKAKMGRARGPRKGTKRWRAKERERSHQRWMLELQTRPAKKPKVSTEASTARRVRAKLPSTLFAAARRKSGNNTKARALKNPTSQVQKQVDKLFVEAGYCLLHVSMNWDSSSQYNLGLLDKSVAALRQCIELDPTHVDATWKLGWASALLGDFFDIHWQTTKDLETNEPFFLERKELYARDLRFPSVNSAFYADVYYDDAFYWIAKAVELGYFRGYETTLLRKDFYGLRQHRPDTEELLLQCAKRSAAHKASLEPIQSLDEQKQQESNDITKKMLADELSLSSSDEVDDSECEAWLARS
jgi:hypothetical protein